jgi:hypothetical protein
MNLSMFSTYGVGSNPSTTQETQIHRNLYHYDILSQIVNPQNSQFATQKRYQRYTTNIQC